MHKRLSKSNYQTIGKLVVSQYPEVAATLLPYCEQVGEKDHSKINVFFKKFCQIKQIDPTLYTGMLKGDGRSQVRSLFLGAMLYIYNRQVFTLPHGAPPNLRFGFLKAISESQAVNVSSISRHVGKVIFYLHHFSDFKTEVIEVANLINPETNGQA